MTGRMIGNEKPKEERQFPHVLGEGENEECKMGAAKEEEGMKDRLHKLSDSVQCCQI